MVIFIHFMFLVVFHGNNCMLYSIVKLQVLILNTTGRNGMGHPYHLDRQLHNTHVHIHAHNYFICFKDQKHILLLTFFRFKEIIASS